MKKIISNKLLFLSTLMLVFATGCGGGGSGSGGAVTLNIWGVFENSENMQQLIADYQEKRGSDIKINYTQKNIEDYESDLLDALASGNGPDVFSIHNDWLMKYYDKMAEAPDRFFTKKQFKDSFVDVVDNDFTIGPKIYAAPLSVDSLALYYNKDILGSLGIATPPKTWGDLEIDIKKVVQEDKKGFFKRSGIAMGTTNNVNRAVDIYYLLMLQNRTEAYTEDLSHPTFDQSVRDNSGNNFFPAADALTFFSQFADPSSEYYTWNSKSDYSIDAFVKGNLAYMYGYSYLQDTIKQKAPNLNYDIASVPQPSLNQTTVNFANYWGFGVSKQSKNQDYAWDFIKFVTSKDELKKYYETYKVPSSRKDLISDQVKDAEIGVFASANLTAKSMFKRDATKVDQIFTKMIDDVVLRGKAIGTALGDAAAQVDLIKSKE